MQTPVEEPRSFTISYRGKSNVLHSNVTVQMAFDSDSSLDGPPRAFRAIWDTGATNSAVTQNVIDQCQLEPTGMTDVHTAQGSHRTETYLVCITLPSGVMFPNLRATKGILRDCDILVGMDIIGQGDFAVTNKDGNTVFSFRMPSLELIDFMRQSPNTL